MRVDDGGVRAGGSLAPRAYDGWEATLALALRQDGDRTTLAQARHRGPLRVQRPFYPEGGPCHVYVLHPPGGIVSGDRLTLDVTLAAGAHALLTAPGAAKLYRARDDAQEGVVQQRFAVADGAVCEWLPPETILFDGAIGRVRTEVVLDAEAVYAGWDVTCLGRPAADERFVRGLVRTELTVRRGGTLQYLERGLYRGGDDLLTAPWGLAGQPVIGLFVVASPQADEAWVDQVRAALTTLALEPDELCAVSCVSRVLVVRFRGRTTRAARAVFERAFDVLRPLYAGRAAVHPRIWST